MSTSIFLSISQEHQRILILVKVIMAVSGTVNSLDRTTTAFIVLYKKCFFNGFVPHPIQQQQSGKENNFFSGQVKQKCPRIAVGLIVVITLRESNMLILQSSQFECLFLNAPQIRSRLVMK